MEENWFREWFNTPYYHQLYKDRNDDEAVFFIDNLLRKIQPPALSEMLDLACGKGRHSVYLASKGFNVTGIDLSKESIQFAKQFESNHLQFFEHDMRMPLAANCFDYVFNFFTSFGYFNTNRENENAIKTIASALKPDGIFVMDYLNVACKNLQTTDEYQTTINDCSYHIKKWKDNRFLYKQISVQDPSIQQTFEFTEKVAVFSLQDFNKMFEKNGLVITEVFGDYALGSFNIEESPRLIMVAQKKI
jgi:SAM-dependent methyltransferase